MPASARRIASRPTAPPSPARRDRSNSLGLRHAPVACDRDRGDDGKASSRHGAVAVARASRDASRDVTHATHPSTDLDDSDASAPAAEASGRDRDPSSTGAPPRHLLCPVAGTLLRDPVIDREGHAYERGAILRWLVLTSTAFEDCGFGGAAGDAVASAATAATVGAAADAARGGGDWGAADLGRGTSPITGRPLHVGELVDDRVAKAAVDRWRRSHRRSSEGGRQEEGGGEVRSGARREDTPAAPRDADAMARHLRRLLDGVSHKKAAAAAPELPAPRAGEQEVRQVAAHSIRGPQHRRYKTFSKKAPPPPPPRTPPVGNTRPRRRPTRPAPPDPPRREATVSPAAHAPRRAGPLLPPPPPRHAPPPVRHVVARDVSCASLLSDPTADLLSPALPPVGHNGWTVPLGVHRVICAAPGLRVTAQVHRRSAPWPRALPPGSYVEVLETRVHGDRVRGRIRWEREEAAPSTKNKEEEKTKASLRTRAARKLRRRTRRRRTRSSEDGGRKEVALCEGWISLQWARGDAEEGDERDALSASVASGVGTEATATDEGAGPWTEPVSLGVYRINFSGGLPLRATPDRESPILGKLERNRCVEVIQTEVQGDRVRAHVLVPGHLRQDRNEGPASSNAGAKVSGWISLLKAGSGGASPVPLGAYAVVAERGCAVTEGVHLDSQVKHTLGPGSCLDVVATRMEEGLVRGLLASGGHITLFAPPQTRHGNGGRKSDGGGMFAMPVPLGTYQVVKTNGVPVTAGASGTSPVLATLGQNAEVEVVETRVEDGRVRGRVGAVAREDKSGATAGDSVDCGRGGWMDLLDLHGRWAKIVRLRDGRPLRRRSMQNITFGDATN